MTSWHFLFCQNIIFSTWHTFGQNKNKIINKFKFKYYGIKRETISRPRYY